MKNLFIILLIAATIFSCSSGENITSANDQKPPNIIFVMTDDHGYQAISAYGSVINKTPNIDRLAQEGMLFDRAYVTNSICSPSRAVILTGKFSHKNGLIDNSIRFDSSQQTFPKLLQKAGYETAILGKWHLKSEPTGFDYWKVLPGQGHYYNPDFRTQQGTERVHGYVTDVITDITIDWLDNKRNKEKPFMVMYQHKAPHREWIPAPGYHEMYKEEDIPEPATLYDDYEGRGTAIKTQQITILNHLDPSSDMKIKPEVAENLPMPGKLWWGKQAYIDNYSRMTKEQQKIWDEAYEEKNEEMISNLPDNERDMLALKYQRYIKDYLKTVASVDDNLGRLLDYLDESGLAENTIIVYTSDQGFYLGEHGLFDKRFMYEESFRTPLIVRWPGKIKAGTKNSELVQNIDFAQTFLDAAGVPIPQDMQGESLLPLLTEAENVEWRDEIYYHFYEYPAIGMVKRHYGVRTDKFKLIHFYYDVDEWELYDLEKDPNELNNVYDNPAYKEVVKELKGKLAELRNKYGDADSLSREHIYEKYSQKLPRD